MSTDMAMMNIAQIGTPILRLYGWSVPTLSIGKFQNIEEINIDYLKEMNFGLVRRPSGGRAVFHCDELTYAVALPEFMVSRSVIKTYLEISKAIVKGLNEIGLNCEIARERAKERYTKFAACFATTSLHEVISNGKKLVGSAQVRKNGVVLQHGSIPMKCHFVEYANSFRMTRAQREKLITRLEKSTTCVSKCLNVEFEDVKDAIVTAFHTTFDAGFVPFRKKINWEKYVADVKVWD